MAKRTRYRAGSSAGAVPQTQRAPNVPNPVFADSPPAMTPNIPSQSQKSGTRTFVKPPPAFSADVSSTQEQLRLSNTMKNTQLNEAPSFDWGIIRSAEGAKVPVGQVLDAAQTTLDAAAPAAKGAPSPQSKAITEAMVPPPVNPSRGIMSGVPNFMMDNKRQIAIGAGGGATAIATGSALSSIHEAQKEYNEFEAEEQAKFDAQKAENEQLTGVADINMDPTRYNPENWDREYAYGSEEHVTAGYTNPPPVPSAPEMSIGDIDMDNYDPLRGYKQLIGYRDSGDPIYQYLSGVKGKSVDPGKSLQSVLQQQRDKNVIETLDDGTKIYQKDKVAQMYYDPVFAYGEAERNQSKTDTFGNTVKSSDIMRPEKWEKIALYGTDPKKTTTFMGEFGPAGTPNELTTIDFSSPFTTKDGKKGKNTPKLPWEF